MTAQAIQSTMSSSPDLNGDAVAEILLRLPSPSVLRCRAICRAWWNCPPAPETRRGTRNPSNSDIMTAVAIEGAEGRPVALAGSAHGRGGRGGDRRGRPATLAARGRQGKVGEGRGQRLVLVALAGEWWDPPDCHPLLLLFERDSFYGTDHLVCNPVTRQWTAVPPLCARLMTRLCGFYLHGPSGEHRLLFLANDDDYGGRGTSVSHYVRSLEAGETRRLGPAAATVNVFSQIYHKYLDYHGKLHWLRHPEVGRTDKILVFDTVSEALRRTSQPPLMMNRYDEPSLLEMDGMVAMAAILHGSQHMDLWDSLERHAFFDIQKPRTPTC
ncbi:hypothetical protein SETIT_3G124000v2 [Setaria italica]|uniref:F-box domain-containing protein n=1 Tax=Setaria italica TaxID=4555 RepID=A0A368QEG0_SETIT|nr:hypothetical protein SETIT_3G124000v2 [Setaria italica]